MSPSPTRPQKVVVHLGPHKTGTTTLQHALEVNERALREAGIGLLTVRASNAARYKTWRTGYTRHLQGALLPAAGMRRSEESLRERLARTLAELPALAAAPRSMLLSDENLLGPMLGHSFAGKHRVQHVYGRHEDVFGAVLDAFGSADLTVYLVKRDFADWTMSSFKDFCLKQTGEVDVDEFFGHATSESRREYEALFASARTVFGPRLIEIDFRASVSRPNGLAETILKSDFPGLRLDLDAPTVANESLSLGQIEYLIRTSSTHRDMGIQRAALRFAQRRLADVRCTAGFETKMREIGDRLRAL